MLYICGVQRTEKISTAVQLHNLTSFYKYGTGVPPGANTERILNYFVEIDEWKTIIWFTKAILNTRVDPSTNPAEISNTLQDLHTPTIDRGYSLFRWACT